MRNSRLIIPGLILSSVLSLAPKAANARETSGQIEPEGPAIGREERETPYLTLNAGMNDPQTLYLEIVPRPSECQIDTRGLELRLVLPNDVKIEDIVQKAKVRKWAFTVKGYREVEIELYPHKKYKKFAEAVDKLAIYVAYKPLEELLGLIPVFGNDMVDAIKNGFAKQEELRQEEFRRLAKDKNLVVVPQFFEFIPGVYERNLSRIYQIRCDRPVKDAFAIVTARVITQTGRSGYVKGKNLVINF